MPVDYQLNDVIKMRKPHPCGGYEWKVVRLGADIGLECLTCRHKVLLTRRDLEHRTRSRTPAADPAAPTEN